MWWITDRSLDCFILFYFILFYFILIIIFKNVFTYFEREKEWAEEGKKEGERENPKQASHHRAEPDARLQLMNHEIMTWTETKSQMLNQLSHPGTPGLPYFKSFMCSDENDNWKERVTTSSSNKFKPIYSNTAWRWQITELLGLHNHVIPIITLIINLSLYICI